MCPNPMWRHRFHTPLPSGMLGKFGASLPVDDVIGLRPDGQRTCAQAQRTLGWGGVAEMSGGATETSVSGEAALGGDKKRDPLGNAGSPAHLIIKGTEVCVAPPRFGASLPVHTAAWWGQKGP